MPGQPISEQAFEPNPSLNDYVTILKENFYLPSDRNKKTTLAQLKSLIGSGGASIMSGLQLGQHNATARQWGVSAGVWTIDGGLYSMSLPYISTMDALVDDSNTRIDLVYAGKANGTAAIGIVKGQEGLTGVIGQLPPSTVFVGYLTLRGTGITSTGPGDTSSLMARTGANQNIPVLPDERTIAAYVVVADDGNLYTTSQAPVTATPTVSNVQIAGGPFTEGDTITEQDITYDYSEGAQ